MRKMVFSFGVIVLFVGVIVFSISGSFVEKSSLQLVDDVEEEWEVSGDFTKGEKLLVMFPPPDWEGIVMNGKEAFVDVEIFDPNDATIKFNVTFIKAGGATIQLESNAGGLVVDEPIGQVGGLTVYDGLYRAHIDERAVYVYNMGPIPWIKLYRDVGEKEYPHRVFMPVGIVLIIAGILLSIYSVIRSKRMRRPLKKRA
jgi:hypothetical protein